MPARKRPVSAASLPEGATCQKNLEKTTRTTPGEEDIPLKEKSNLNKNLSCTLSRLLRRRNHHFLRSKERENVLRGEGHEDLHRHSYAARVGGTSLYTLHPPASFSNRMRRRRRQLQAQGAAAFFFIAARICCASSAKPAGGYCLRR